MKPTLRRILLALLTIMVIGSTRADTADTVRGRLETGARGEIVLTLDLAAAQLASLADKAGQEANLDVPALADLIRERFHYLLRLRIGGHDVSPTSVDIATPPTSAPRPDSLTLTATWANVDPRGRGEIITQTDTPGYRLSLQLVDKRVPHNQPGTLHADANIPIGTAAAGSSASASAESWSTTFLRAIGAGFVRMIPGGIEQMLFVLGLCFAARRGRDLARQVAAFTLAHGLTFALAASGVLTVNDSAMPWVGAGLALSVVGSAVINIGQATSATRVWLALVVGFGLVHGLAFSRAVTLAPLEGRALEAPFWASLLAAHIGIVLRQLVVIGVAALLAGAWRWQRWSTPLYRPAVAVPASVAIGIGGLVLAATRAQSAFGFPP